MPEGSAQNRHTVAPTPSRRLDSWKEIAEFLRVAERTAVRWEKERGLPVYRVPGGKRGAVYAESSEIDTWLRRGDGLRSTAASLDAPAPRPTDGASQESPARSEGEPESSPDSAQATPESEASVAPPRHSRGKQAGWAGAVLIALGVAWAWFAFSAGGTGSLGGSGPVPAGGTPTRARILPLERVVVAESADGQVLWRHEVAEAIAPLRAPFYSLEQATHIADLDGDGDTEILAAVPVHLAPESGNTEIAESRLLCFSSQGRLLWEKVFREELVFRRDRFQGPWSHGIVSSLHVDGTRRVLWAVHHWNWWPSVLLALDHQGREISRFVHAGHITRMTPSERSDRPYLLIGGVSNAYQAGFLAVLDGEHLSGAGPTEPGSPYECADCPPGSPARYLLFEPSEVTRAAGIPYNGVNEVLPLPSGYSIQTADWDAQPRVVSYFELDLDFRLRHADSVAKLSIDHRALEREGKLDHSWEACPERERPPRVRLWEPGKGWSDLAPFR